ncbi:hypothetical protein CHS0354_028378 [Potamilus streckersoni]|uniref:Uncharacterized protein n=1 Tax=Potamilus streckersoni TaxID=2493646 RepID=A0AAE0RU24_9BIVA|nr:hypothetical protein CHS0354_028378 [Potamilus streckersoni]
MEPERITLLALVSLFYVSQTVDAVVPYYYHRAKIESARPEKEERVQEESFEPTQSVCCKIGEKAARKRLSCTADTQFLSRKMNHVHKVKMDFTKNQDGLDINANTLYNKISKCAVSYSKYFMKCCNYKADFYKERRMCRTMETLLERQKCREDIKRKYS